MEDRNTIAKGAIEYMYGVLSEGTMTFVKYTYYHHYHFLSFAKWPSQGLIIKNIRSLAMFMPETSGEQRVIVRAVLNQAAYSSAFVQLEASSCGSRLFSPTYTFHTYALK